MKILLVTRGAQGNIYPFLAIAMELKRRGHIVTLCIPRLFEQDARDLQLDCILEDFDQIDVLMEGAGKSGNRVTHFRKWLQLAVDYQFDSLIPLLQEHDLLVACNTELAAASIAEYCKKPFVRTSFAPYIPGKHIPPPLFPYSGYYSLFKPAFLWKTVNKLTNLTIRKIINRNRIERGMMPIRNFGNHTLEHSKNLLLYSRYVGTVDKDWKADWKITGYCFNDLLPYEKSEHHKVLNFIRQDERPVLFFTFGSCNDKRRNQLCEWLLHICKKQNYKLIVGTGWSETGVYLQESDTLYLQKERLPHTLFLPYCTAVIHHGGCGMTHNVARAGIPQFIIPLLMDQYYWADRVFQLQTGPRSIKISSLTLPALMETVTDLVINDMYKVNAEALSKKVKNENGLHNSCVYIERSVGKDVQLLDNDA